MTTVPATKHTLFMSSVYEAMYIARASADPVATLYIFIPRTESEGTLDSVVLDVRASGQDRPVYDANTLAVWDVPVFKGMSDGDLRRYARRWIEGKLANYYFPTHRVEIKWDEKSLQERTVDTFVTEINALQERHEVKVTILWDEHIVFVSTSEGEAAYPIKIQADGRWTVEL